MDAREGELESRLAAFLVAFLGGWPPQRPFEVVASPLRSRPGWDGTIRPLAGVRSGAGTVVSVPEADLEAARQLAATGPAAFSAGIGAILGRPDALLGGGVFRACRHLVDLGDPGVWVAADDARLPEWLALFAPAVLVAFAKDGRFAAGVGLKAHHRLGQEIAVGTEPEFRGRGLARALVAQAARHVYELGGITTYLHAADNTASAAVAAAAGFPDEGWEVLGLRGASATT